MRCFRLYEIVRIPAIRASAFGCEKGEVDAILGT